MTTESWTHSREKSLRLIFGPEATGYVCVAYRERGSRRFREEFFTWPDQVAEMSERVEQLLPGRDIYFCPQLLNTPKRLKTTVETCPNVWIDLDDCPPGKLLQPPTVLVESSPSRWQAYWVMEHPVEPEEAERLSRRIAYFHAKDGADRSGWDLSQLLRMPFTFNYKRSVGNHEPPMVQTIKGTRTYYRLSDFSGYPEVTGFEYESIPKPTEEDLPQEDPRDMLERYKYKLNYLAFRLFNEEPEPDTHEGKSWSEQLWKLELSLLEAGMSREETFVVARASACNKYARDGKDEGYLWQEVCRAWGRFQDNVKLLVQRDKDDAQLVEDGEELDLDKDPSFVERYVDWARSLGDAAPQYHHAAGFIALSSLLAGAIRLPTSFGTLLPNLWFMLLADTTLTRKSTSMDLAMDLLQEVDSDVVLATDGSIEGLFNGLATRPGRPSVFLRDEFSGLLEAMVKKDYYAGMPEMFTKLYDGKMQRRVLRRETIEVKDPVLIIFAGGIKSKICSLLTHEHVTSGFIPRFIFIAAESDITRLKPLGPPTSKSTDNREVIKNELLDMMNHYRADQKITIMNGKPVFVVTRRWDAGLTPGAWARYNKVEADLLQSGLASRAPEIYTPIFDRMAKSTLKAAVLLAAARQRQEQLVVDEIDVLRAASYAERWRSYARDVIKNVGKTSNERVLESVLSTVVNNGGQVPRSILMQNHWLNSRDTEQILTTLKDRGLITRQKIGGAEMVFAVPGTY